MPLQGDAAPLLRPTYTNITPLGTQGSMSWVYKAHHEGFDSPCVQKVVPMAGQPAAVAFAEPRLLKRLEHDNLVKVLDAQPDPNVQGAIVFTMPYYRQGSARFALEQGYRFSLQQVIDMGCDLLTGLGHLHANGLVDRDVKPANLLLSDDLRRGLLTDLGVAARIESDGRAPGNVGTPLFMAPECFGPGARVGVPGDIYGVGLTMIEMVNGPWPYAQIDVAEVQRRLGRGWRGVEDALLELPPHVPPRMRTILLRAVRRGPDSRFQSARSFVDALRRVETIDWRELTRGPGLQGEWEGSWPPRLGPHRRRLYRVSVAPAARGHDLVVTGFQRIAPTAAWRRCVADLRIRASDSRTLTQFFSAIRDRAIHVSAT
jgi:eukaryotic-like serine/threonine-protein kinase